MPGFDGLATTNEIVSRVPLARVLVLSMHTSGPSVRKLVEAGAAGFLFKHSGQKEIIEAVREVAAGGKYLRGDVLDKYISVMHDTLESKAERSNEVSLTKTELTVLKLVVTGMTSEEIAEELHRAVNTVSNHRKNLLKKFGVSSTARLIANVQKSGYLDNLPGS